MNTEVLRAVMGFGLMVALGCGGETPTAETSAGDEEIAPPQVAEAPPEEEEWEEEEEPAEVQPAGPGQLLVTIRMGGEDRPGTIEVLDVRGASVAEGSSGETLTLPAGNYRVVAMMDPSLLPGHGPLDDSVTVREGRTTDKRMTYEAARVRLDVRRNGRPVANWTMRLTREDGDMEVTMRPSQEHQIVAPGRYSGVLTTGNTRIEVSGLIFQGGATMDVPVNVN